MTGESGSCVCIHRVHRDVAEGTFLVIKLVDDPFCPGHHPGEVIDLDSEETC